AGLTSSTSPSSRRYHSTALFRSVTGRPAVKVLIFVMMQKPPICPTKTSSAAASGSVRGGGLKGFDHVKTGVVRRIAGSCSAWLGLIGETPSQFSGCRVGKKRYRRRPGHCGSHSHASIATRKIGSYGLETILIVFLSPAASSRARVRRACHRRSRESCGLDLSRPHV